MSLAEQPTFEELLKKKKEDEEYLNQFPIDPTPTTILTSGQIANEIVGHSQNPHECHQFKYTVKYKDNTSPVTHVKWVLTGDFPFNVQIDPTTGVINGTIWLLNMQPNFTDLYPTEPMRYDGSNWNKCGRPRGMYYDFKFYVSRVVTYLKGGSSGSGGGSGKSYDKSIRESSGGGSGGGSSGGGTPITVRTPPVEHIIRIIRSHTIDNLVVAIQYTKQRYNKIDLGVPVPELGGKNYVINKMNFLYEGVEYGFEDIDKLIKVHPGPWPDCYCDIASMFPGADGPDNIEE